MRRNYPKSALALFLSCTLAFSSLAVSQRSVSAEPGTEAMVMSGDYNLALGKSVVAKPSKGEGSEAALVQKVKATVKKLKAKKTYYFKVRAFVNDDGELIFGAWSAVKSTKIK